MQASSLGYLGVDVFFVLSGFLITSLLLIQRNTPYLIHNFYWKRVLRIWPVLLVHLLLFAVLVPHSWRYVVLSLLFLQNFSNRLAPGVAGPTWTLSIEEQFYLLWPQAVSRFSVRTICAIAFTVAVVSVLLRIFVPLLHHDAFAQEYTWYRLDGLGLGAILACQWFAPAQIGRGMQRVVAALQSPIGIGFAIALALASVGFSAQLGMIGVGLRSTIVCFATYRLISRVVVDGSTRWLKWLSSPVLAWLGAVSYALYMYHGFVLDLMLRIFGPGNTQSASVVSARFLAALGVSLLASQLSLVCIERPAERLRPLVLRRDASIKVA